HALGVLFGFIRNQGDGWAQALNYLTRYLDDALSTGEDPSNLADPDVFFLMLARQLGIRTAEMHRALAEHAGDDSDFTPEPISREDIAEWRDALAAAAAHMLSGLERGRSSLPAATQDLADRVLGGRDAPARRSAAGGGAKNDGVGRSLAAAGGGWLSGRLPQDDAWLCGLSGEQEADARDDGVLHAREGRLRGVLRVGEPARLGRHHATRYSRAS